MPLENDMKKQEHLWQNQSPNFLAEKAFNAAVAALQPHCAVCSLFCPYTKVPRHDVAHGHISVTEVVKSVDTAVHQVSAESCCSDTSMD